MGPCEPPEAPTGTPPLVGAAPAPRRLPRGVRPERGDMRGGAMSAETLLLVATFVLVLIHVVRGWG